MGSGAKSSCPVGDAGAVRLLSALAFQEYKVDEQAVYAASSRPYLRGVDPLRLLRGLDERITGQTPREWLLPVCLYLWEQAAPQKLP